MAESESQSELQCCSQRLSDFFLCQEKQKEKQTEKADGEADGEGVQHKNRCRALANGYR